MDFRILDASAFYAGIPFGSTSDCYTTSLVYDEIKHIKKNHEALETLLETNRLKIREPDKASVDSAIKASKNTGDYQLLAHTVRITLDKMMTPIFQIKQVKIMFSILIKSFRSQVIETGNELQKFKTG